MVKGLKRFGEGVTTVGLVGCFAMLVVGTIAIDIVILAYLAKETENSRSRGNQQSAFLTGMLWGMMFSNNNNRNLYGNVGISLLLSPITTGIAIALSFYLGVPAVGIGLVIGWLGVAAIAGIGLAIYGIADYFDRPARIDYPYNASLPKTQQQPRPKQYEPVVTNSAQPAAEVVANQRSHQSANFGQTASPYVEPTAPPYVEATALPYGAHGFFSANSQSNHGYAPPPYSVGISKS